MKYTQEYLELKKKKYKEYQNWYYLNVTKPKREQKKLSLKHDKKAKSE